MAGRAIHRPTNRQCLPPPFVAQESCSPNPAEATPPPPGTVDMAGPPNKHPGSLGLQRPQQPGCCKAISQWPGPRVGLATSWLPLSLPLSTDGAPPAIKSLRAMAFPTGDTEACARPEPKVTGVDVNSAGSPIRCHPTSQCLGFCSVAGRNTTCQGCLRAPGKAQETMQMKALGEPQSTQLSCSQGTCQAGPSAFKVRFFVLQRTCT